MNLLITAGNTQVMIDRVRCLTNIFTGRTGAALAGCAAGRGHHVTILTSHPETVAATQEDSSKRERCEVIVYRTFEDLQDLMAGRIPSGRFDAVIHAAAVADYLCAGVYAPMPKTRFDSGTGAWFDDDGAPTLLDRAADKVKSDEPELWLRLTRAPKLVDRIRTDWGFGGQLVKFKLEVGVDDATLLESAEQSRVHSHANWMVANTLEGAAEWAFLGPFNDGYHKVSRQALPTRLIEALEGT